MSVSAYRITPPAHLRTLQRLNLGCGRMRLGGMVNIDSLAAYEPDLVHDFRRPLPYPDISCAEVVGMGLLQRLPTRGALIFVLNEVHRVLDQAGTARFRVPNALSKQHPDWAIGDPTACQLFCKRTFSYFDVEHEHWQYVGQPHGILPWRVQIYELDGDGTLDIILQPVKEVQS
jgi:hypothetical protein